MLSGHLREAIKVNRERKSYYSEITKGKSLKLSRRLIMYEKLLIIPAIITELFARKFIRKGIPVLMHDFLSMEEILPAETKPEFTNVMSDKELEFVWAKVKAVKSDLKANIKKKKFTEVNSEAKQLLKEISDLEKKYTAHLAMLKHIVESIVLISSNAEKYSIQSKEKTDKIYRFILKSHSGTLKVAIFKIDKKAQQIHKLNCGIIVNDVPGIDSEL